MGGVRWSEVPQVGDEQRRIDRHVENTAHQRQPGLLKAPEPAHRAGDPNLVTPILRQGAGHFARHQRGGESPQRRRDRQNENSARVAGLGDDVQQFIERRQKEEAANAAINRELAILKRALNLGRRHTPPKIARLPHIPMQEENNVGKGFFEHDEYLRMRQALREDVRPLLVLAHHTGCRKGEILSLRWDQVDLSERLVRLHAGTTKNDEPRVIPVAGELHEMLEEQKRTRDAEFPHCEFVFSRDGRPIRNSRKSWDQACIQARLVNNSGAASRMFHDLRRTGVRNLIRAGAPEKTAMAIGGHKTGSVFDRYNIVGEGDLKDAAAKLAAYLKAKSEPAPKSRKRNSPHTMRTPGARKRS